jgi:hypothetical protein
MATNFPNGVESYGAPVALDTTMVSYAGAKGLVKFVDGSYGSDTNSGKTPGLAVKTIQKALDLLGGRPGGVVYVFPKKTTSLATDPTDYAETLIINNNQPNTSIIGVGTGLTQGGLPQLKIGAGTTAMIDVRAPGCTVANLGINGASSTGGGIKLDDDGGTTYVAFGTTITNCHFKNCKTHATNGAGGGAIYTTTSGNAWQTRITNCVFYKNVGGIVVAGTSVTVPQDWIIQGNVFGSSVNTEIDVDIYVAGSGVKGLLIDNNKFLTVDVPTGTSGTIGRYIKLASGSYGMVSNNRFACLVNPAATEVTFGAAGTAAIIPTTVRMAGNIGETSSTTEQDIVYRT